MFGDIVLAMAIVTIVIIIFVGVLVLLWKRDKDELLAEPGHMYGQHWTHE